MDMKITQSFSNQSLAKTAVKQQVDSSRGKLLIAITISVLLTLVVVGSIIYFWQKSANEKAISSLEQRTSFLEKQFSTMKNVGVTPRLITGSPSVTPSPKLPPKNQEFSPTPAHLSTSRLSPSKIKYTLPDGWEAKIRPDLNDLFLTPKEEGGFLAIKVYPYDVNIGRRKYYCQVTGFCIDGITYFTPMQIGNISGYEAAALDNSGGGGEYFGAKADKFYIISRFSPCYPPSSNYFDKTLQQVLDSLVF